MQLEQHEFSRSYSGGRRRPCAISIGPEEAKGGIGDQVALNVEIVVDGGVVARNLWADLGI